MAKITITAEQLGKLLNKAGLKDSDEFKALTEGEADAELTQDQFDKLASGLLSITDAIKHPEVIKGTKGTIFAPTEAAMVEMLKANGLDDEGIKKLLDGKSNADKVKAALEHVKALVDSDKNKTKDEREKEWAEKEKTYKKSEADLQKQLLTEQQARQTEKVDYGLETFLLNKDNFQLNTTIPVATQLRILKEDIRALAQEKGAVISIDPSKGLQFLDKEDPTKQYFPVGSTEPANPKELILPVIEKHGFLNKQQGDVSEETVIPQNRQVIGGQVLQSKNVNFGIIDEQIKAQS